MRFDAIVHITTDREVIDADRTHLSLNEVLRGRRTDIDKIFDKPVVFPTALGVLGAKQHALPCSQAVRFELFRKNRPGVRDGDHARRPDRGVEGQFIEARTVRKEMSRCIHVSARMRTHLHLGYVGRISTRQILDALDAHGRIVGPVHHSRINRHRDIDPIRGHLITPNGQKARRPRETPVARILHQIPENWTMTLMSSGLRSNACWKFSGVSRRVMRPSSHFRSALAKASPALYQCRLLAFTLPTTTLFFSTAAAATSAMAAPAAAPPLPTPVRHTIPLDPTFPMESAMTWPTPVHSMMMSGSIPDVRDACRVIRRTEGLHQIGLVTRGDAIQDMDFESILHADESREKADGPCAGYEHLPRFPERTSTDHPHHLPRFGHNRRRLKQYAEDTQRGIQSDRVLGFDPPSLGHIPVDLLDAPLGVLPVAAHVPFAHRTIGTGNRVRAADDPDHQVALFEGTSRTRINDAAEGFVAQHETGLPGRRPAVLPLHDLDVGPADPDRNGFHQHGPVTLIGLRDLLQPRCPRLLRFHRDGVHMVPS